MKRAPRLRLGALAVGVAGGALALRLCYLLAARALPLFAHPVLDSRAYLDWAAAIAAGDWLSRHQGVFYQAPLYPYFVAFVQTVFGDGLWPLRLAQALCGSAACGLLVLAGERFFDRRTGLVAGLLLAFYPPLIFTEGLIQKEALAALFTAGALLALARALAEPLCPGRWFVLGALLGLFALLRENTLLVVPVLGLWLAWSRRHREPRLALRSALGLALGALACLAPVALRNLAAGGEFLLTTAQSGPNFFIGNHAGASGTYQPLRAGRSLPRFEREDARLLAEQAAGRRLSAREISVHFWRQGLAFARAEPGAWLRLLALKCWMVCHRAEQADTDDYRLYTERLPLLGLLDRLLNFAVLLALAAAGVVLTWERRGALAPLYLALFVLLASVALFFVFGRYRLPAVPLLALFAGAAPWALKDHLERGHRRRALAGLLTAALAAVASSWPPPASWSAGRGMAYVNLGVAYGEQGRLEEAMAEYRRALELTPDLVEAHLNLGNVLLVAGRLAEARPHLERAFALQPEDPEIRGQLELLREAERKRGD